MDIYKKICEKLGCEPKDVKTKYNDSNLDKPYLIDDRPSIWSVLTLEEMLFIKDNGLLNHSYSC